MTLSVTQELTEVLSRHHSQLDISQELTEILSENWMVLSATQEFAEVLSKNWMVLEITQEIIEVLSSNTPLPSIPQLEAIGNLPASGVWLLVRMEINGIPHYLSNTPGIALTHYWDNHIISFDVPGYQIDQLYGGYARFSVGSLEISAALFATVSFPPDTSCPITIWTTATTEEDAVLLFEGTAHIKGFDKYSVRYDLYEKAFPVYLLEEVWDYDEKAADIVKEGIYKWAESSSGDNEFYLLLENDEDPEFDEPERIIANGVEMPRGTAGSLKVNQWDYKDNDSLGFSTIYCRAYNNGSPDIFADGWLRADYQTAKTVVPKVFGTAEHITPRKTTPLKGLPTFFLCGITGEKRNGIVISSISTVDFGKRTLFTTAASHGFAKGDSVRITGTVNYNNIYEIYTVPYTNSFIVDITYTSEDTETGYVFRPEDWIVFDSGVPVNEDMLDNGNGTFSSTISFTGEMTLTGTGEIKRFEELFVWGCERLGIAADMEKMMADLPELSYFAEQQALITDFLSDIAAFFSHLFYIRKNTLYLADMMQDNGEFTPEHIENITYSYTPPIKYAKISYVEKKAGEFSGEKMVMSWDKETARLTDFPYGNEIALTPYITDKYAHIIICDNILRTLQQIQVSMTVSFDGDIPMPGSKVQFEDDTLPVTISGFFRVRSIQPDFNNEKLILTGEMQGAKLITYQLVTEVVRDGTSALLVYQVVSEVVRNNTPNLRLYQVVSEIIRNNTPKIQIFQIIAEVVRSRGV